MGGRLPKFLELSAARLRWLTACAPNAPRRSALVRDPEAREPDNCPCQLGESSLRPCHGTLAPPCAPWALHEPLWAAMGAHACWARERTNSHARLVLQDRTGWCVRQASGVALHRLDLTWARFMVATQNLNSPQNF